MERPEQEGRADQDRPAGERSALPPGHWSRGRDERNQEALEHLRSRSRAPGVAEGGGSRNFWCMDCGGVVPHEGLATCPHCGAKLEGRVRRYFNWVEIDRPVESDLRALLGPLAVGLLLLAAVALFVWWLLR